MARPVPTSDRAWPGAALLRHDAKIARTALRTTLRRPSDLVTIVIATPFLILVARAWIAGLPHWLVDLQAAALGVAVAFYSATILAERWAYHRTDGVLASSAQQIQECFGFAAPLAGASVAAGLLLWPVLDLGHPVYWLGGTLLGSLAGAAWAVTSWHLRERQLGRHLPWARQRPSKSLALPRLAAVGAALGIICAFLPAQLPSTLVVVVMISVVAAIALGRVDAEVVQFRTLMGHSSWRLIRSQTGQVLAFFLAFAAALALGRQSWPPTVAAFFAVAATAFLALRVLAYQCFTRRIADWVLTGIIGAAAIIGLTFPPLAPLVIAAAVIWLARQAAQRSWLTA